MSDPVFVDCPAGEWTEVATNVTSGTIWKTIKGQYLSTYKMTGGGAPTTQDEGVPIFRAEEPDYEAISATAGIDVYIWPVGSAGRVRVDV